MANTLQTSSPTTSVPPPVIQTVSPTTSVPPVATGPVTADQVIASSPSYDLLKPAQDLGTAFFSQAPLNQSYRDPNRPIVGGPAPGIGLGSFAEQEQALRNYQKAMQGSVGALTPSHPGATGQVMSPDRTPQNVSVPRAPVAISIPVKTATVAPDQPVLQTVSPTSSYGDSKPVQGDFGTWLKGLWDSGVPVLKSLGTVVQAGLAGAAAGAAGKPEEGFGLTIAGRQQAQANTLAQIANQRQGIDNNYQLQMLSLSQDRSISDLDRALKRQEITQNYIVEKEKADAAAKQAGLEIAGKKSSIYDTFGSVK